ncbi:hypothetical protein GCM10010873_37460 [Cypionkella aquatica]|uniref:Uncharacterized protein n=1 Tax=Cypionkella aquatica TaxID=1756042 RepID=A0AA37X2G4_9RHOB|nr:hypothetical protein [Cypionkella aquatica]GLS88772.1 hypothetical protein GCM10010873_37460 [Cypionkella aquatica]
MGSLSGHIPHTFNTLPQNINGSPHLAIRWIPQNSDILRRIGLVMKAVERPATLASTLLPLKRSAIDAGLGVATIALGGLRHASLDPTKLTADNSAPQLTAVNLTPPSPFRCSAAP